MQTSHYHFFIVACILSFTTSLSLAFTSKPIYITSNRSFQSTSYLAMAPKEGVSTPDELKKFVQQAGSRLLIIDVRNPDATIEPGDQKSLAVASLPSSSCRPQAVNLIYDRSTNSMPLSPFLDDVEKDTPIITHCGGGGRGQLAKEFLESNGFTNVLNGGGPKETECWNEYGNL